VLRANSAFYGREVIAACRRAGDALFDQAIVNFSVRSAIAEIPEDAWISIKYPRAIFDESSGQWISDAQIAETTYRLQQPQPKHRGHRSVNRAPGQRQKHHAWHTLFLTSHGAAVAS
jgi:hypothetical protein